MHFSAAGHTQGIFQLLLEKKSKRNSTEKCAQTACEVRLFCASCRAIRVAQQLPSRYTLCIIKCGGIVMQYILPRATPIHHSSIFFIKTPLHTLPTQRGFLCQLSVQDPERHTFVGSDIKFTPPFVFIQGSPVAK